MFVFIPALKTSFKNNNPTTIDHEPAMPCSIGRWFARDATGARGGKVAHGRQRFPRQGLRRAPCPKAMHMTACESTTVALRFSVSTPEGNGTFKKHQNAKPQKTKA